MVYTGVIWQVVFFCALWVSTYHPLMASRMLLLCVDIHNENQSYTDMHDVDEDLKTILCHGASWVNHATIGIAMRYMTDSPTATIDSVASLKT